MLDLKIITKKVVFRLPKSKIVLFDAVNKKIVIDTILFQYDYFVLDTRGGEVVLNYRALLKLFKRILSFNNKSFKGYIKFIKKQYFLSVIDTINPTILLTYIDNDPYFHKICKARPGIVGIGIQNGARTHYNYSDKTKEKFNIPYYFVHGNHAKSTYISYGHQCKKIFEVGSIKLDYYMARFKSEVKYRYQICLISTWTSGETLNGVYPFSSKNQYNSLLQIKNVIKKQKYSLVVALKTNTQSEKDFYKDLFADTADYHYSDNDMGSYDICMKSKVILSTYSTLGFEMQAIGKDVIFFNLCSDKRYTHSSPNTITSTDNDKLFSLINRSISGNFYYKYNTDSDIHCVFNKPPSYELIKIFIDSKL
jgi:surface carbohydrate biosynthesis protein